ncbi:MAG: LPS export ABC transporter periplasmic protein LptC [Desulfuromonas sp.]|nr:MAG: LPS export ABC transporter periplasmic protein LptC [Desulfuromonas sp.]
MSRPLLSRHMLLVLAVLLFAVLGWVAYSGYRSLRAGQGDLNSLPIGAQLALDTIDYTHLIEGVERWRLRAERVERQTKGERLELRSPYLLVNDENGDPLGELRADSGWVSGDYLQVALLDDVVVVHVDGYRLETSSIDFNQPQRIIETAAPFKLIGESLSLSGVGMEIDLTNRRFKALAEVKAEFLPGND